MKVLKERYKIWPGFILLRNDFISPSPAVKSVRWKVQAYRIDSLINMQIQTSSSRGEGYNSDKLAKGKNSSFLVKSIEIL